MCVISGSEARRVERLDPEAVKDEIEELLGKVFKDKEKKWGFASGGSLTEEERATMYRPVDIHVCKWDSNPHFHGSYSFLPVGAYLPSATSSTSWSHLTSPVDPSFPNTIDEDDETDSTVRNPETKDDASTSPQPSSNSRPTLYFAGEAYDDRYSGFI